MDEKNIFSTTFSDFIQIRLKRSETRCWFQKHIYQCTLWHWMSSYDITWHLMTADVIWWHQMSKMYWSTCFWNQHSISNHLSLFSTKSKNVVEKIFFSSKGPPFGFWPFSGHFKIFASRCHSLKIELEGWNFQRMSQSTLIYMFWYQHWVYDRLSLFWRKNMRTKTTKIFFSSKCPPFGFWPFLGHFECFVPHVFASGRG